MIARNARFCAARSLSQCPRVTCISRLHIEFRIDKRACQADAGGKQLLLDDGDNE